MRILRGGQPATFSSKMGVPTVSNNAYSVTPVILYAPFLFFFCHFYIQRSENSLCTSSRLRPDEGYKNREISKPTVYKSESGKSPPSLGKKVSRYAPVATLLPPRSSRRRADEGYNNMKNQKISRAGCKNNAKPRDSRSPNPAVLH
jgi:hypothetical protein